MAWPGAKPELSPPLKNIEFYLNESLVLELDNLGFTLVEGMNVTYIDYAGEEVTHRIGDIHVILREERFGSPPSGLGDLHVTPTLKVNLQP